MIVVCKDFDLRLDMLWYRLQNATLKKCGWKINQVDLDSLTLDRLESLIRIMEEREENK